MAVLPILITGSQVLHTRAAEVTEFDEGLRTLVADMFETMEAAPGVGLAAPQDRPTKTPNRRDASPSPASDSRCAGRNWRSSTPSTSTESRSKSRRRVGLPASSSTSTTISMASCTPTGSNTITRRPRPRPSAGTGGASLTPPGRRASTTSRAKSPLPHVVSPSPGRRLPPHRERCRAAVPAPCP
jgi:hypothetical protein